MDTTDLTSYLNTAFALSPSPPERWHWQPPILIPAGVPTSAAAYADVLRADAVRLGSWLTTDDGRFAVAAVRAMTPRLAQPAERFLIEALIEVAAEQTDRRKQNMALLAVGAAVFLLVSTLMAMSSVNGAGGSVQ